MNLLLLAAAEFYQFFQVDVEESAYLQDHQQDSYSYISVVAFGIGFVRDRYFNKINFAVLFVTTLVIGVLF